MIVKAPKTNLRDREKGTLILNIFICIKSIRNNGLMDHSDFPITALIGIEMQICGHYPIMVYKEWGSLRSPTPCLCMHFICVSTAWKDVAGPTL